MFLLKRFAGVIAVLFVLNGCQPDDNNGVPGYIYVEGFDVETDFENEGTAEQRFTDVWVNVEGRVTLGGWELPALIPVLEEGATEMQLQGGVHQNGIATTRARYDYFEMYTETVNFVPGAVDTIRPVIRYRDNVNFLILEDFSDEDDLSFEISPGSNVETFEITNSSEEVFEGKGSFKGQIENQHEILEIVSKEAFVYPGGGANTFVEVHFRSDVPIVMGVNSIRGGTETPIRHLELNPNDEWRKVYIHLTTLLSEQVGREGIYRIFFGAINHDGEPKTFYLDNIKLIQ